MGSTSLVVSGAVGSSWAATLVCCLFCFVFGAVGQPGLQGPKSLELMLEDSTRGL